MWGSCLELGLLCVLDEVVAALSGFGTVEVADTANLARAQTRRFHITQVVTCSIPYSVESTEQLTASGTRDWSSIIFCKPTLTQIPSGPTFRRVHPIMLLVLLYGYSNTARWVFESPVTSPVATECDESL